MKKSIAEMMKDTELTGIIPLIAKTPEEYRKLRKTAFMINNFLYGMHGEIKPARYLMVYMEGRLNANPSLGELL